jgi:hypothetical protein
LAKAAILIPPEWRQGSVVPRELLSPDHLPSDLPVDAKLIAISHDCDIASPSLDSEPWLEILVARPVGAVDGSLTFGKNPRKMHLSLGEDATKRHYELDIHEKFRTGRMCLIDGHPDASLRLDRLVVQRIARWVGKRYSRPSFPNAFDRRIPELIRKKIKKLLARDGADIRGIFLALTDDELEQNQPYLVVLRLVIDAEAAEDDERERLTLSVLAELQDLMNQCEGVAVFDAELKTVDEFSLVDYLATKAWDYEYLSSEQEAGNQSLAGGI